LLDVGIPGIAICQWGTPFSTPDGLEGPSQWTPPLSNSYRVSDDIAQGWPNVMRIMNQGIHVNLKNLSGPGRWSDMDMLEVGNPGMTIDEQASHFAIWSMFKSTLLVSTHISTVSRAARDILLNKDLISINQDPAGLPVELVQRFTGDHDVFAGELENGDRAVLILDQSNSTRTLSINFALLGVASATVKDLWSGQTSNRSLTSYSQQVNPHGSLPLRLSNIKLLPKKSANVTWIQAESGLLEDGADVQDCSGCSGLKKVGSIYSDRGSLTLSGIMVRNATQDFLFDYINCEIGYLSDQRPNVRKAAISVNGGVAQVVDFPLTGKLTVSCKSSK
jgi:alpha-galactosidase